MINSNGNVNLGNDLAFVKNLTPRVRRGEQVERGTSGTCLPSPARACSACSAWRHSWQCDDANPSACYDLHTHIMPIHQGHTNEWVRVSFFD